MLDYIDKNARLFARAKHISWSISVDIKARERYVIWLYVRSFKRGDSIRRNINNMYD